MRPGAQDSKSPRTLYSVYSPGLGPCLGWRVPWAWFKDLWSPAWVSCSSFDGFFFQCPHVYYRRVFWPIPVSHMCCDSANTDT